MTPADTLCCSSRPAWNQARRYALGLARMLHSKYTSSPSLMSLGLRLAPMRSVTTGGEQVNGERRRDLKAESLIDEMPQGV
ncbi:hypothetical protein FOCC_FOCC000597 [Frankliniella occidentalis]|nr:hypothetical protein FOCC_FOCC000597 [Frankliniella occidentalis]